MSETADAQYVADRAVEVHPPDVFGEPGTCDSCAEDAVAIVMTRAATGDGFRTACRDHLTEWVLTVAGRVEWGPYSSRGGASPRESVHDRPCI